MICILVTNVLEVCTTDSIENKISVETMEELDI